jgi:hypothetical protein
MTTILDLYLKERDYQKSIFGNSQNANFNVASFMQFIEEYLAKAKHEYTSKWDKNSPDWMLSCKEFQNQDSAPVKTYEHLIKVFALTGAALELFCSINVEEWRKEGPKPKWIEKSTDGEQ